MRRAEAVAGYLSSQGALDASFLRAVSYGESRNRQIVPGAQGPGLPAQREPLGVRKPAIEVLEVLLGRRDAALQRRRRGDRERGGPGLRAGPRHPADRAVVITTPHAVADTFHTDWANRAQDKLGIPVLHLYSGSGYIGDS